MRNRGDLHIKIWGEVVAQGLIFGGVFGEAAGLGRSGVDSRS